MSWPLERLDAADERPVLPAIELAPRVAPSTELTRIEATLLAEAKDRHWTMLLLSTAIVVLSFVFRIDGDGHVAANSYALPPLCPSRAIFHVDCPGCGLTRSFVALAAGDFAGSRRFHAVGWIMALVVVLQIPYRIWSLRELRRGLRTRIWPRYFGNALIAMLVITWILKTLLAG